MVALRLPSPAGARAGRLRGRAMKQVVAAVARPGAAAWSRWSPSAWRCVATLPATTATARGDADRRRPHARAASPRPGRPRRPSPGSSAFYAQELDWEPCSDEPRVRHARGAARLRRPRGETIELALLKVPGGAASRVGSLVVNPGGPGAPGTDYAAAAEPSSADPLLERFDIVGFDPRGTGDSSPVDCLTDAELDDYVALDPDPDTAAEEQQASARSSELRRGLRRAVRRPAGATSPRSRRPATWTCCGPRSARSS